MTRRDPTILIALLIALGAHLALLGFGVQTARRDLGWWLKAPPARASPLPVMPIVEPQPNDPMQRLGDHDTNGTSINTAPGEQPMESALADARQEQAALQRDPAGFGGKGSNQQLDQTLRGDNGDNAPRGTNSGAPSAASVFGSRESSLAELSPKISAPLPDKTKPSADSNAPGNTIDPLSRGPQTMVNPPKPIPPSEQSPTNPTANSQTSNQQTGSEQSGASSASGGGAGGKAGAPEPGAGNPIPTSDFESYPVTRIASRFIAGKIEARTGRKLRTRELPKLGLAAHADLQTMDDPYVVLVLKIDTTGNVTDVKIERSSGSDNVDLPCQRAAYTWWFEPRKDPKTGQIHPEEIEFTIYF
ncbi:MAG: TonB family protein [Tepidisphaeraceae bacterium]